jgi:hypothetical protein
MVKVQAETCSLHVKETIRINLCCVRLNNFSLFSNNHNGMASTYGDDNNKVKYMKPFVTKSSNLSEFTYTTPSLVS